MTQIIEKTLSLDDVELKTEGDAGVFRGYASKFNGIDSYGVHHSPRSLSKGPGRENAADLPEPQHDGSPDWSVYGD